MTTVTADAIIFAGGRGSRLGGIDKAALVLGERRMVDRAIDAARKVGVSRVIVAGPAHAGILADRVVREDPPLSGPLAALAAGLAEVDSSWTLLLACDLVYPAKAAQQLLDSVGLSWGGNADTSVSGEGVVLIDEAGYQQWLASCVRTLALRHMVADMLAVNGHLENLSLRAAFRRLDLQSIAAYPGSTADIDTPGQFAMAQESLDKDK